MRSSGFPTEIDDKFVFPKSCAVSAIFHGLVLLTNSRKRWKSVFSHDQLFSRIACNKIPPKQAVAVWVWISDSRFGPRSERPDRIGYFEIIENQVEQQREMMSWKVNNSMHWNSMDVPAAQSLTSASPGHFMATVEQDPPRQKDLSICLSPPEKWFCITIHSEIETGSGGVEQWVVYDGCSKENADLSAGSMLDEFLW